MFKDLNRRIVRQYWLFSIVFCAVQMACCNSITIVYAYHHITDKQKAILMVIAGALTFLVYTLGKSDRVRQWVCRNYTLMAVIGIVIDGGTELLLLHSAFAKFLADCVCLATFFKFYRIQMIERVAAIFSKKKDRANFDIDVCRADAIGVVAGGFMSFVSPAIDIEIVVWISTVWTSATYITSWYRFYLCDKYMSQKGILLPCMMPKKNVDD